MVSSSAGRRILCPIGRIIRGGRSSMQPTPHLPVIGIQIHTGAYAERVFFRISGKEGAHIVFSEAPGETVTVKGLEVTKGAAHLTIANLKVEGFKSWGVSLEGSNHHVTLSGLTGRGARPACISPSETRPLLLNRARFPM
jgi:hypothetical protein